MGHGALCLFVCVLENQSAMSCAPLQVITHHCPKRGPVFGCFSQIFQNLVQNRENCNARTSRTAMTSTQTAQARRRIHTKLTQCYNVAQ